jgi:murein DD-endopeptidase MepM/ murein hydrolase activator NlpD
MVLSNARGSVLDRSPLHTLAGYNLRDTCDNRLGYTVGIRFAVAILRRSNPNESYWRAICRRAGGGRANRRRYASMEPQCFPVEYPPGFDITAYRGHRLPTDRRSRDLRLGGAEIAFENSFIYGREGSTHNAIDIHGAIGLRIVSTTDGHVVRRWVFNGRPLEGVNHSETAGTGFFVVIVDDEHFFHHYAHMMQPGEPHPGDRVSAGQLIGFLGQTGLARGNVPHLHYQLRGPELASRRPNYQELVFQGQGGDPVNPYNRLVDLAKSAGGKLVKGSQSRYFIPSPTLGVSPTPLLGWRVPSHTT